MKTYIEKGLALYWEPANPTRFINHAYSDKVIEAFESLFNTFPVIINKEHLPTLRAMQRIGGGRPLEEVIDAVEKEGEIRLWWDTNNWREVDERERQAFRLKPRPVGYDADGIYS